jgi:hypothetical protein
MIFLLALVDAAVLTIDAVEAAGLFNLTSDAVLSLRTMKFAQTTLTLSAAAAPALIADGKLTVAGARKILQRVGPLLEDHAAQEIVRKILKGATSGKFMPGLADGRPAFFFMFRRGARRVSVYIHYQDITAHGIKGFLAACDRLANPKVMGPFANTNPQQLANKLIRDYIANGGRRP